jgi:hypothetical protein
MMVTATALAALSQAHERVAQAAQGLREATAAGPALDDQVDLSAEALRLLVAKDGYDAAIELAKTADEMSRRAIDLLA